MRSRERRGETTWQKAGPYGVYEKSPSSLSSASSSSSSTYPSSTAFNSSGLVVTTSKSVPHSGQEITSPSSTSSSSTSKLVSHSGQSTIRPPLPIRASC